METSAAAIGGVGALGKEAAKKAAKEYALPRHSEQFLQELQGGSTLPGQCENLDIQRGLA